MEGSLPSWPKTVLLPVAAALRHAADTLGVDEKQFAAGLAWMLSVGVQSGSDLALGVPERAVREAPLPEGAIMVIIHAKRLTYWCLSRNVQRGCASARESCK